LLVTVEVALALVLLVGAALFMQSLSRLMRVEPGFLTDSILTFRIELPRSRYPDPSRWTPFLGALTTRLAGEPGVLGAGAISWLPLTTDGGSNALFVEGRPLPAPGAETYVIYRLVTPGYFAALGIPVRAGRGLTAADGAESPRVVVVNETMAKRYWPGESPLGRRVSFSSKPAQPGDWMTVVGVVGDTRQGSLAAPVDIEMFAPGAQEPNWFPPSHVVVRTSGNPLSVAEAARRHVRALDPLMPVADMQTMDRVLSASVASPRFETVLIGSFGAIAAVLAAIGVYGLMSLSVALRRREIGIRTALGAGPREISRMVLAEGARVAGAGIAIGLVIAAGAGRWIETLLYDTPPTDAPTAALTAALLLAVAMGACYLPARRAARVDPVKAMN
jgi:putative ABC transport system permease protein